MKLLSAIKEWWDDFTDDSLREANREFMRHVALKAYLEGKGFGAMLYKLRLYDGPSWERPRNGISQRPPRR